MFSLRTLEVPEYRLPGLSSLSVSGLDGVNASDVARAPSAVVSEKMVRKYFGTDGIRGRANGAITPELAR